MTYKELREKSRMSRTDFSIYFNIPYRTIQNWDLEVRSCPTYIVELMQYKLKKEGLLR